MNAHVIDYWLHIYHTKHGYRWRVLSRRMYFHYTGKVLAGGNW
jgi:hypothetical protein